jgi:4-aminobutyrate aminotransferase-like enzyme
MVDIGLAGEIDIGAGKPYGLVLDIGGYFKNVITLAPNLHITKDEIDLALKLLDKLLRDVTPA